jgi:hypothetical protein
MRYRLMRLECLVAHVIVEALASLHGTEVSEVAAVTVRVVHHQRCSMQMHVDS